MQKRTKKSRGFTYGKSIYKGEQESLSDHKRKSEADQRNRQRLAGMKAIVYTSNTGHTAQYAKLLGEKTGLPVYALSVASKALDLGSPVIYLGWLFANSVKGYKKATKLFEISAVCAVGLCDTGTAIEGVRKANAMQENLPLFTMQGGMDKTKLRGVNAFMIRMLTKGMEAKNDRTGDDERMLYLLKNDKNYVSEENITAFMQWYNGGMEK